MFTGGTEIETQESHFWLCHVSVSFCCEADRLLFSLQPRLATLENKRAVHMASTQSSDCPSILIDENSLYNSSLSTTTCFSQSTATSTLPSSRSTETAPSTAPAPAAGSARPTTFCFAFLSFDPGGGG